MACRCNERRTAIVAGIKAAVRGETDAAADQAKFVVKSAVEDAQSAFRSRISAARNSLSRR